MIDEKELLVFVDEQIKELKTMVDGAEKKRSSINNISEYEELSIEIACAMSAYIALVTVRNEITCMELKL